MSFKKQFFMLCAGSLIFMGSCDSPLSKNKISLSNDYPDLDQLLIQFQSDSLTNKQKFYQLKNWLDHEVKKDSVSARDLSQVAYTFLNWDSVNSFKTTNQLAKTYAEKNRDTFALADIHWNYANYYFKDNNYTDAYYHYNEARKGFSATNNVYFRGKMLINMSYIRGRLRDYSGSESLAIRAINAFNHVNKSKSLYAAYNHLAILSKEVGEYQKSLAYHEKALSYLSKDQDKLLRAGSWNNIGVVYQKLNEYQMAQTYFNRGLENNDLKQLNPGLFAKLVDNLAFNDFLTGRGDNIESKLMYAKTIRDSIKDDSGTIMSNLHLSKFYLSKKDPLNALAFGKAAQNLAQEINNNRDYLLSLMALKEADPQNSLKYAERYIFMNDSLQNIERNLNNLLTRIDLETDEYKQENIRSNQEKLLIAGLASIIIFLALLIVLIKEQRAKNKILKFQLAVEEANEEVFMLTLQQQHALENGKNIERQRISEELHDGVLSQLFASRMGLSFLNFSQIEGNAETFQKYIEELITLEKEIRSLSHDLSSSLNSESNIETLTLNLIKRYSSISKFDYKVDFDKAINWSEIPQYKQLHMYRIIQESLLNIVKYAKAANVMVTTSANEGKVIVTISDDGVGFNPSQSKYGIGLKNIKSRLKKIDGSVHVDSKLDKGTILSFVINQET